MQILKALTGATIIATDMKEDAMAEAEKLGAITVPGGEGQVEKIAKSPAARCRRGIRLRRRGRNRRSRHRSSARQGRVSIVGIGNLSPYEWAFLTTPYEAELVSTYWGTVEELHEVVDMFKAGQIVPQVTTYSLDDALEAYQKLVDGEISGRA